jgi:superfamily II DNA/RNA helicase
VDFYDLDLDDYVLDALDAMHFETCTPIQEQSIPVILQGKDIIGVAQTGTGKTAAYLLPVLSQLCSGDYSADHINCIIMSPTRELAQQIDQAIEGFSYYMPITSLAIYGGNDGIRYEQEKRGLARGADIIIATPGRFISHLGLGNVDLSHVSFFILDEADRMLDMGFAEDIMQIEKALPKERQTIMFSATMPTKIQTLAKTILKDPVEIKLSVSKPAEKIRQTAYICYENQKIQILKDLFEKEHLERVIIFGSSKSKVKEIAIALKRLHLSVDEMHSDLDQSQRDKVMYAFKANNVHILVATDIVARGIDIDDIQMVINFDVPHDAEDYVHRIGRTARANRDGRAITFVNEKDFSQFKQIERFLEKEIEKTPLPDGLEAPHYKEEQKGKNSHKKKSGGKKNGNKKANGQPKAAAENAAPASVEKSAEAGGNSAEAPKKKRKHHHRRKKSGNAPQEGGTQTPASAPVDNATGKE